MTAARAVALLGVALGAGALPTPAAGQDTAPAAPAPAAGAVAPGARAAVPGARAALAPDTATVGDVVRAAVRLRLSAGATVQFPDSLSLSGDVESAGRVEVETREVADGLEATAVYPLRAWRTGTDTLPAVPVRIRSADGTTREVRVGLPPLVVRSVLPADTAGLEARPAKDVLGADRVWWLVGLLALLAALALALLGWWLWRRTRRRPRTVPLPIAPRRRALNALDAIREDRLADRGEFDALYARTSHVAREYLDALDPAWGLDRTTTELGAALLAGAGPEAAARMRELLREADRVKFARLRPASAQARAYLDSVRDWIQTFVEPGAEADETAEPVSEAA